MLKHTQIKSLKAKEKPYTVADGQGLSIVVNPNGSKKWRFRYRIDGKAKTLSLGAFPEVSISDARERLLEARKKVANGVDPIAEKKAVKKAVEIEHKREKHTFKSVADEYLKSIENTVSHHHYQRSESLIRIHATPVFGSQPIEDITHKDIKKLIVNLSEAGSKASAKKLYGVLSQVFGYAVMKDLVNANVVRTLMVKDLVKGYAPKEHSTITKPEEVKKLLANIKGYQGYYSTSKAMLFMVHTALRSYNVRALKWEYISGDVLTIPKEEMKISWDKMAKSEDFRLPLSKQALEILESMKPMSHGKYVFPSTRGDRPLSENALLVLIRNLGYEKEEFTPHGCRAMFSTLANEKANFNVEIIDAQLAHKVGNTVSRSYNRGDYFEKRRELSQWWSDYLDSLEEQE